MDPSSSHHVAARHGAFRNRQESGLFKWVSLKELLLIFVACSVVAMLIRTKDTVEFSVVLRDNIKTNLYTNGKSPSRKEKM